MVKGKRIKDKKIRRVVLRKGKKSKDKKIKEKGQVCMGWFVRLGAVPKAKGQKGKKTKER